MLPSNLKFTVNNPSQSFLIPCRFLTQVVLSSHSSSLGFHFLIFCFILVFFWDWCFFILHISLTDSLLCVSFWFYVCFLPRARLALGLGWDPRVPRLPYAVQGIMTGRIGPRYGITDVWGGGSIIGPWYGSTDGQRGGSITGNIGCFVFHIFFASDGSFAVLSLYFYLAFSLASFRGYHSHITLAIFHSPL